MKLGALLLAGVAAAAPVLAGHALADVSRPAPTTKFAPPSSPLLLSRTVIRELSDGKRITVMRRYKVRFVPRRDGFLLDGELVDVRVDAPPLLARLAELERQRPDPQLFPMVLDTRGVMIARAGETPVDPRSRAQLIGAAGDLLAGSGQSSARQTEGSNLAEQLTAAAPYSPWPSDLFIAVTPERRQHRSVALASGGHGEVDVLIRVGKLLPCGLPAVVERTITTQTQGVQRVSREVWTVDYAA